VVKNIVYQIPPHLSFCTPGQNQEVEQGTNSEITGGDITKTNREKSTEKQTDRFTYPQ